MNDEEFLYFFHGTNVTDLGIVGDIFTNGLVSFRGNDMLSTLWPVKISEGELKEKVKEYVGTKGNAVFVIKIPKYYLTPKTVNDTLQQIPLPIWKKSLVKGENGQEISYLAPELVYGVYIAENETFKFNPNYSPVHNPIGLQYDNQQIQYLLNENVIDWYNFAVGRNRKTFEELKSSDEISQIWDRAILQYQEHFEVHHRRRGDF